jgi:hypothetical protein
MGQHLPHRCHALGDDAWVALVQGDPQLEHTSPAFRKTAISEVKTEQVCVGVRERPEVADWTPADWTGPTQSSAPRDTRNRLSRFPPLRASPVANGRPGELGQSRDCAVIEPTLDEVSYRVDLFKRTHVRIFVLTPDGRLKYPGWDSNPHVPHGTMDFESIASAFRHPGLAQW